MELKGKCRIEKTETFIVGPRNSWFCDGTSVWREDDA